MSDNAVLSFTGELESPMGIRINRYDLNGNDNYDFLSTIIQNGFQTIRLINSVTEAQIDIWEQEAFWMGATPNDPTPTQLYVSGIIVGNTTDFGENNYEDFLARVCITPNSNPECYQYPLLTYQVNLQSCCSEDNNIIENVFVYVTPEQAYGLLAQNQDLSPLQLYNNFNTFIG